MHEKIGFSGRSHKYTDEEIALVVKTMQNADPLTQGKYLTEYEEKFAKYLGVKKCFAVSNATAALELSAQLCNFKPEDEIIIPSHTFTCSAYPFFKKGAKIIWADIDLESRVVNAKTLAKKISKKTKAIVVAHLYGFCADMPEILEVARKYKLIVIEDAAQSLGTEINKIKSGVFGDFGVFSLHSHKNITTLGEGGMLYVKDDKYAELVPMLRHNGHCGFPFSREKYWIPAMGNLDMPELDGRYLHPNNFCLGEVACALGIKLLERIDKINEEKRKRAILFIDALNEYSELVFHRIDDKRHNYHLLAAMFNGKRRDDFIKKMYYEKGIKCIVQYYPLNRYPFYQKVGFGIADCPNADKFFDNMISFPFHHWLSDSDFRYMLQSTKKVLEDLRC